jgi:hypothetical protein
MQMHLDFRVEDVPVGVEWAIACGATQAQHQPPKRDPMRLRVMLSQLRALEITRCTVDCERLANIWVTTSPIAMAHSMCQLDGLHVLDAKDANHPFHVEGPAHTI